MQEASQQDRTSSRLLKFYSGYRLLLSAMLLWRGQLDSSPIYFGHRDSSLFSIAAAGYLVVSLISLPLFHLFRWRPSETLLFAMSLVDVVAINLMLYRSGGMAGSMGYLLMVTVAATGTILSSTPASVHRRCRHSYLMHSECIPSTPDAVRALVHLPTLGHCSPAVSFR